VLEIALEHQRRGADISKIVVDAGNTEQELENLKMINMLKEKLDIPFLFLSGGECKILRRIGGEIGSCMYLCVYEYDSFSTLTQPLLSDVKLIRYLLNK
jgi:3-dehydroquinate dehydratase